LKGLKAFKNIREVSGKTGKFLEIFWLIRKFLNNQKSFGKLLVNQKVSEQSENFWLIRKLLENFWLIRKFLENFWLIRKFLVNQKIFG
jgi:hypothetical protein